MDNKELAEKIQRAANEIHLASIKGIGNHIIVSSKFQKVYEEYMKDMEKEKLREERKNKLNKLNNL